MTDREREIVIEHSNKHLLKDGRANLNRIVRDLNIENVVDEDYLYLRDELLKNPEFSFEELKGSGWHIFKNPKYKPESKREKEIADLSYMKLKYDKKISERIYKTYRSTRIMTFIAFLISVILAYLKAAEVFKWWPYH
ncbi:MAG: hypothetical protein JNK14_09120 [Chitinophagaceae bacterium]|nr:hypothetical protein [Chitinophagaceae bacterium]